MPRKRHVSRNAEKRDVPAYIDVMPRKRHVSRNELTPDMGNKELRHASQEACE